MTDYVYSGRCALFINVGPRFAGKSKADQQQIKSEAGFARQPKGPGGEATPRPIASLAITEASRVRCATSSPVPAHPR